MQHSRPMVADDDRVILRRFVARTAEAMLARGWEADPNGESGADSIFLGLFQQPIGTDWLATVEFIREGGPIYGVELRLRGPRRVNLFRAIVGGEIGLRHAAAARLLRELDVACEANITRDLKDIFEDEGVERPVITDEASADRASDTLVAAVDAHALTFARRYADVDAVVAFITEGKQTNRDRAFEHVFVPALLAASGRYNDARASLRDYRQFPKPSPEDEEEYERFADDLSAWVDEHSG